MKRVLKKIFKKIKNYDNIVIARHIGPDPDAVASQISLRDSIRLTFPNKEVLAVGNSVAKFKSYGYLDKIPENFNFKNSLLIVLDVPNILRVDGVDPNSFKEIIKIDHHPYEDKMGDVEYVDINSSSTCQMIIELILNTKLLLNKKIAENLYLGVVSDSDRFLFPTTTVETFDLISEMIKQTKIDFTSLYPKFYERELSEMKFHGYLSQNLTITESGLGYILIEDETIKEFGVDTATASNMVNDFNFVKEMVVWTFITHDEKNGLYKINIRSRGPIINEVAASFNGGGHKYASGIRTTDKREIENIIKALDEACVNYLKENDK